MTREDGRPPSRAERLLARALAGADYAGDIVGDLHEAYRAVASTRSPRYARWWYRAHALRLATRYALRLRPRAPLEGNTMDRLRMQLRYAVRALIKQPMMSATIVATLALAIGANAAVFGVIDALVLHPLTLPDVDRLVMPFETSPTDRLRYPTVSPADFLDWRPAADANGVARLTAFQWWDANLEGRDEPERLAAFFISPDFFSVLDVAPTLGRAFRAEEELPANARRVLLSDGLWRRRFGADPAIVGRSIRLDGASWIVVGVMPPKFDFPQGSEIWAPLAFDETTSRDRTNRQLTVVGRLHDGRTIADMRAQLGIVAERIAREHPASNRQRGVDVYTLSAGLMEEGMPTMLGLWQAAGLFVLLIACANIANLLLARGVARGREVAVRLALGSSRARIVWECLLESALLAAIAMPLAFCVAHELIRAMRVFMPGRVVRFVIGWRELGVDGSVIAMTMACGAAAAIVFGILPAIQLSRGRVGEMLKSEGRADVAPGRQRLRNALVVAEIALALPLLVMASLSVSTVTRYLNGAQGYDPENVLTLRTVLPPSRYPDAESQARFATSALDRLAAVPTVRAVAAGNVLPSIVDTSASRTIEIAGQPLADAQLAPRVDYRAVTPDYFGVLRMPIVAGRAFAAGDVPTSEPIAIVSDSMARRFWPDGRAIGERVRVGSGPWRRVVGVCGDIVQDWLNSRYAPTIYLPLAQAPTDYLALAIRTAGDPGAIVDEARRAIARVDPAQPVYEVMSLRQVVSERTIGLQYIAGVMGLFASMALLLALLGLYAVMTFMVSQRVREIGVRMALGATRSDVTRLTLSQAARLTFVGIALGVVLAVMLGRAMEAGLLGLVSSDIRLTLGLAAALAVTSLAASYLPARRAASIDPMLALRAD